MTPRMFVLRAPRHPLVRFLLGLLGLAIIGTLLVFSFFAFLALAAVGAVLMLIRTWRVRHGHGGSGPETSPRPDPEVLEGEYVIIHESRHSTRS